jgi:hypothetical protein
MKLSVSVQVEINCSWSLSALDQNSLCVVEMPLVLADALLGGRLDPPGLKLDFELVGSMLYGIGDALQHTITLAK